MTHLSKDTFARHLFPRHFSQDTIFLDTFTQRPKRWTFPNTLFPETVFLQATFPRHIPEALSPKTLLSKTPLPKKLFRIPFRTQNELKSNTFHCGKYNRKKVFFN